MRFPIGRQRLVLGLVCLAVTALAAFWARSVSLAQSPAAPPGLAPAGAGAAQNPFTSSSDYSRRPVAYIYGTTPITREELGEYLIAREGADRLVNMVNKRIIEHEAEKKGITVTQVEIETDFAETLKGLGNLPVKDFVDRVLKQYHKTLYEWKEDVIKPRILMSKLCRDRVKVTEEDLHQAFDAEYGEKVECRIIIWPKGEEHVARRLYGEIRDKPEEFERQARTQADPNLAAAGGRIKPIGHHGTGNEVLERAAFNLHKGELSEVIETPRGVMVIKCVDRIPPQTTARLEDVREALSKDIFDKKIQAEIPKLFKELHDEANPQFILKNAETEEELVRAVQKELQSASGKPAASTHKN
jgi:PPIC-type PPIASE domain